MIKIRFYRLSFENTKVSFLPETYYMKQKNNIIYSLETNHI